MLTASPSLDRTKQKKNASLCDVNLWDINLCDVKLCDVSVCVCGVNLCDVKLCDVNLCDVNLCDVNLCDVKLCDVNLCDVNLCDVKLCDVNLCDVNLYGVNLCDVKLCDVNLCDFNLCGVNLCDVNLCDVKLCDVNLCDVNLCDVKLCDVSVRVCDVNLCGVCLCDVNLCDVKLCDVNLCNVNLCDVNLCDVKLCDVNLCDVNLCDVKLCDVNLCDFNLCDVNLCDVNLCDVKLCDVNLCDVNLCDVKLCDVSVRVCDVNLCGVCLCDVNLCDVNLCDVNLCDVKLCDGNLCDVNLCDVKLCDVSVRVCDVNLCGDINLHTARRQTRMPARHPHKMFAPPIGTATPNAIYTQQGTKPECQQDIHTKFSHLLLAQLPRTQFTHSKPPNPHARKTSTQNFRSSYWHSHPERNLHTARRQTRMPAGHQRKFAQLLLAQLPGTQFTQSTPPNPNASRTSTQNFRSSYWHSYPERNLHTASRQTRMPGRHQHAKAAAERRSPKRAKAYIRPRASAPNPTPATQKQRQSGGAQNAPVRQSVHQTPRKCSKPHTCHAKAAAERRRPNDAKAYIRPTADAPSPMPATQKQRQSGGDQTTPKRTSDPLQMHQVPRLPRKSSSRAAETKRRQSVHQTPCSASKSHACHAKAATEPRRPNDAKAYIRPPADAPSPTPATQKQRQSGGDQTTPKRTSDPLQVHQAPRLPRKSSSRAAETKRRQSVHQTPCSASKPHACHAKAATERRTPNDAKAYIRPHQVPSLPRKSSDRAAETKRRQSVHQTPCRCSKPHACHAKAATEPRRPNDAKAYIRPPAGAPSPTPATQKQRQSRGDQTTPKRTSDPLQMLQVPRLPRKSSDRAAETKRRQSVHQTPCRCSKSHAWHQTLWYQAVWCQAVWCQAVWCQPAWCQPAWCQAVWCQAVWCQPAWCQPAWCQPAWCQAVWCQAVWCQAVWCQAMWCVYVLFVVCVLLFCVMWCEAMWCEAVWREAVWWSCVMCVCVVVCVLCVLMLYCVMCVVFCCCVYEEGEAEEARRRRRRWGGASLKTRTPHANVGNNKFLGEEELTGFLMI